MTTLVDTSALVAILNRADPDHTRADATWAELVRTGERLRTHSYVVIETTALVQARQGIEAVRVLQDDLLPAVSVRFVDRDLHRRAMTSLLAAGRRRVSLVDWTSFELMREERLSDAFAFDDDFADQGVAVRP